MGKRNSRMPQPLRMNALPTAGIQNNPPTPTQILIDRPSVIHYTPPDEIVNWCYDFNKDLKYGDYGIRDIGELKIALRKEGLYSEEGNDRWPEPYYFDESIESAVIAFQEKHAEDILSPFKLRHGTGFFGIKTRNKLNTLYGCNPDIYNERISNYNEGITNGSFENEMNGWKVRTEGEAGVLVDNGRLALRIYKCSNSEVEQTFVVNKDVLSFDWQTGADGWYELPEWELLVDGGVAGGGGFQIDASRGFSGKKEVDISNYKGKIATLKFKISQSSWCYMFDHTNTYLWIDNVE